VLKDDPVTVTTSPGLPWGADRFRVARLVQAKPTAAVIRIATAATAETITPLRLRFIG
jgi:hypothetical protein